MDEGKFAADFIAKNLENIFNIASIAYKKVDAKLKIKLKLAYKKYLSNTRQKYSKSKSFFIRNQSVDLYSYYIPTGIRCERHKILRPIFKDCLDFSNRIVITGTGGSGKTVLIKHLFLDCIKNQKYTPVLIELRDLNSENITLNKFIEKTLEIFEFNISSDFINGAKKAGHFCFFLDGFDEVNYKLRSKLLKQIKTLSRRYPKCPIFISSRPDNVFNGVDDYSIFEVMPLNLTSAVDLIERLPFDKIIKKKFIENLSGGLFEKHSSFLSNPLLLSIMLLTYSENAEIPSKLSIFYNQAYEALFRRHDAYKGGYTRDRLTDLDIQDFSRVFSLFALQTYEKGLFKMPRTDCLLFIERSRDSLCKSFTTENYLSDLLSAACLLLEDGLDIAFSHRSFQEYFVALHISQASPEIQEKLIDRYWLKLSSDNVIPLLLEINPELVERVLFVPQLEKLFSKVGIKRKVGITHTAKYFKSVFKSLNIEKNRLSATAKDNEVFHLLLRLVISHSKTYTFPSEKYFKAHNTKIYEKYAKNKRRIQFKTENMTFKTPVLVDILNGKGAFSIIYFQAGYDAFQMLKKKHENRSQNINDLLGI
jgi:predicted NACHT family NTPase